MSGPCAVAPLWDTRATGPGPTTTSLATVGLALLQMPSAIVDTPGNSARTPAHPVARAMRRTSCCSSFPRAYRPSRKARGDDNGRLNPPLRTLLQDAGTPAAGTRMAAESTGPGSARTLGKQGSPNTCSRFGLTG